MTPPDSIFDSPLAEKEQFTKPGTANVTPGDLKKLGPLMKHYKGMAKPFTACKADQLKHGLSEEHANRRCAVLMDLGVKAPGWRSREDVARDLGWAIEDLDELIEDARSELKILTASLGVPAIASIATGGVKPEGLSESDATLRHLAEEDIVLLEWFDRMPETTAEAFNPPSWMTPAAAKAPGFRPIKPPKKSSSSTTSSFNSEHPRGTGALGGQFIRKGASGGAVKAIQQKLGIKTTGTVEGATVRRIRTYQENHNLKVDGVIGSQTAASLLGRPAKAPGALTDGLTRGLRRLTRKLHAEALNERAVHVQHTVRDNGIKAASTSSIRSALFDLADRESPTHTVKLPNGTKVKAPAGVPGYSSYRRKFVATNGKETVTATGTDEAADVAKELDSRTKLTESELDDLWPERVAERAIHVSGYYTKSGKHVDAYSQVRSILAKLKAGGSAHFPDGLMVHNQEGEFRVEGGSLGTRSAKGVDQAAKVVALTSGRSTHPKSIGGKQQLASGNLLPGASTASVTRPSTKGGKISSMSDSELLTAAVEQRRMGAGLPSDMAAEIDKRDIRARMDALMKQSPAKKKGDSLVNFDTGKPKVPSTAKSRAGSRRLGADLENQRIRKSLESAKAGSTVPVSNGVTVKKIEAGKGGTVYRVDGGPGKYREWSKVEQAAQDAQNRATKAKNKSAAAPGTKLDMAGTMDARDVGKGQWITIGDEATKWEVLGKTKGGDVQVRAKGASVPKTIYATTSVKPLGKPGRSNKRLNESVDDTIFAR